MDPDENLRRQREVVKIFLDPPEGDFPYTTLVDAADDLAALCRSLDEWIVSGGVLPTVWRTIHFDRVRIHESGAE